MRFSNIHIPAKRLTACLLGLALMGAASSAVAQGGMSPPEDNRSFVKLDPSIKAMFLAEMRKDLENLDDILTAIAEKKFELAARIAERKMGLAHRRIERMEANGASDEEIAATVKKIRKMGEKVGDMPVKELHRKMSQGMMGVGNFMPDELQGVGQAFHLSAYDIADAARLVAKKPDAANYQKLFSAINDMTTHCRGCHDAYRVR